MNFNLSQIQKETAETEPESQLVKLALEVSSGIIINGGETSRADACAVNMLKANGGTDVQVFSLPTVVLITVTLGGKNFVRMKMITTRDYDLGRIDLLNNISRAITEHQITVNEAFEKLNKPVKKQKFRTLYSGLSAGFFAILFGGGAKEFVSAVVAAFFCQIIVDTMQNRGVFAFVANFVGSFITAVIAILFNYLINSNVSIAIIGGIISLVPGIAVINATRDSVNGDLVSGSARWLDAAVTAASIAAGVGAALALSQFISL